MMAGMQRRNLSSEKVNDGVGRVGLYTRAHLEPNSALPQIVGT